MKKNNKNSEKLHQFPLTPYPRTLWIAISTDKFEGILQDVPVFDTYAIAQVDTTDDGNLGGFLIRFLNKESMTPDIIAHEATHVALHVCDYIGAKDRLIYNSVIFVLLSDKKLEYSHIVHIYRHLKYICHIGACLLAQHKIDRKGCRKVLIKLLCELQIVYIM